MMRSFQPLITILILLTATLGASGARAQNSADPAQGATVQDLRGLNLGNPGAVIMGKAPGISSKGRRLAEEAEMQHSIPERRVLTRTEPWLGPNGEPLVGVIDNTRMLTKPQLDLRVNLALQHAPKLDNPEKEEARRIAYEESLLSAWTEMNALALHAERLGHTVSTAETDKALHDLAAQSADDPAKASERIRMTGIPEQVLSQELRDGLLVEKMVHAAIEKIPDADLMKIFNRDKDAFLPPASVKAWQLFHTNINLTRSQQAEARKEMEKLAKRLRRAKRPEDYQAIQKELEGRTDLSLSYLERVTSNEKLPPPVMKAFFSLDPGDTSKVVDSDLGWHVIKVLERHEAGRGTFTEAKPQVQNYLFEKTKDALYEQIKGSYKIRVSAGGLKIYHELMREDLTKPVATRPAADAATAAGSLPPSAAPARSLVPATSREPLSVPSVEAIVGKPAEHPTRASSTELATIPSAAPATLPADKGSAPALVPDREPLAALPSARAVDPAASPEGDTPIASLIGSHAPKPRVLESTSTQQDTPLWKRLRTSNSRRPARVTRGHTLFKNPPPSVDEVLSHQATAGQ